MNLVQICYAWRPDPIGGTEIYVEGLARELTKSGHRVWVLAPGVERPPVEQDGFTVYRYPTSPRKSLEQSYGQGDPAAAAWFERWLQGRSLDAVHFHAATSGQPIEMMRAARRLAPVVLTYHTPTVTCARGTMMLGGRRPCDGRMRVVRCGACLLQSRGLPSWAALAAASIPEGLAAACSRLAGSGALIGGVGHWMRLRHDAAAERLALADRIVSPCDWVSEVLAINGVGASKIVRCDQGVRPPARKAAPDGEDKRALRIGWFGRACPQKAPDILVRAVLDLPRSIPVSCELYGILQSEEDRCFWERLRADSSGDTRLGFHDAIPRPLDKMTEYDVVAVTGRWLETGPLVLLEAFAAGVPVLGADLGGIHERIRDGFDGWLVPPEDSRAWSAQIRRLAEDLTLVRRAAAGITPPRTERDVATRMEAIYRELNR